MTEYASFEDLTATPEVPETEDVELPSGKVVQIRPLSRHQLITMGKGTEDASLVERRMITYCLVQPKLTIAQVETWQRQDGSIRDFARITTAVRQLSGLAEGAAKSDVDEVRD